MSTLGFGFRQLRGALPPRRPRWRQARAVGGHSHAEGADLRRGDTGSEGGREAQGGSMHGKGLKASARGRVSRAPARRKAGAGGPRPYLLPG